MARNKVLYTQTDTLTNITTTTDGAAIPAGALGMQTAINVFTYTNVTPTAKTFNNDTDVSVLNNTITITAHGYVTGLLVRLTTTGTLPGGLALATDYFVIVINASTIKLASSLALALAGTAVTITTTGSAGGVGTVTATAIAATMTAYGSNDDLGVVPTHWASTTTVAMSGAVGVETTSSIAGSANTNWIKFSVVSTAGMVTCVNRICLKGLD